MKGKTEKHKQVRTNEKHKTGEKMKTSGKGNNVVRDKQRERHLGQKANIHNLGHQKS